MSEKSNPFAVTAAEVPARSRPSVYPEAFASRMAGREKRQLGDLFGLKNFGVNLTRLAPNAVSALRHAHTKQDEFVYILQGRPTLQALTVVCARLEARTHSWRELSSTFVGVINETAEEVVYLEVGDRTPGDEGSYPDDDLKALLVDGKWRFVHKNGVPY
ncbi:MAG TPA: cupin [Candidatus Acidoferrum sp.]|nr:cupin [Candidatus Acidoferrum sp.]